MTSAVYISGTEPISINQVASHLLQLSSRSSGYGPSHLGALTFLNFQHHHHLRGGSRLPPCTLGAALRLGRRALVPVSVIFCVGHHRPWPTRGTRRWNRSLKNTTIPKLGSLPPLKIFPGQKFDVSTSSVTGLGIFNIEIWWFSRFFRLEKFLLGAWRLPDAWPIRVLSGLGKVRTGSIWATAPAARPRSVTLLLLALGWTANTPVLKYPSAFLLYLRLLALCTDWVTEFGNARV